MKTTILQLELYDNHFSILDRMEWSHANRILLVWPKRVRLVEDKIDLLIIQRQAVKLGAQLAIVCRDVRVIESANALNISVFASISVAERSRWKSTPRFLINRVNNSFITNLQEKEFPQKTKKAGSSFVTIFTHFVVLLLGILAIVALLIFLVPSATVTLYPQSEEKQITISIWASPQVHEINVNGNLPAVAKQVEVSGELSGQSSGFTGIPSAYASGEVTLTNLSPHEVTFPQNSIVSTSGNPPIRFLTTEQIVIPAGINQIGKVTIKAMQSGTSGNLDSGTLTVLEGDLGAEITVNNELPISGGEDQQSPSPNESDYQKVQSKLLTQLQRQALTELATNGDVLITNSLDNGNVVSEVRSLEPGQPGEQFSLTITVRFSGLVYSQSDMTRLVDQAMAASLGKNERNYSGKIDRKDDLTEAIISTTGAKWQEVVTAEISPAVDNSSLAEVISGKPVNLAAQILQEKIDLVKNPSIIILPSGWKWLPFASYQIHIKEQ